MRKRAQPWLGTLVEISIGDALGDAALNQAFQAAFAVLGQIHSLMSFHAPASEVSRINQAEVGASLTLHAQTTSVISAALRVCDASAGLFDIRVASQLAQWAYLPQLESASVPVLPVLPYQAQECAWRLQDGNRVQKLRNDWMDLGGIAKGYAVDQAILALQQAGVQHACVNAGGDLRVIGESALEIVIRDPAAPGLMRHAIHLKNQALATSATYFSAKMHGQQRVSALVHGVTGRALSDVGSISVRADACVWADALTKVVAASGDAAHPSLSLFAADAFIIGASS